MFLHICNTLSVSSESKLFEFYPHCSFSDWQHCHDTLPSEILHGHGEGGGGTPLFRTLSYSPDITGDFEKFFL